MEGRKDRNRDSSGHWKWSVFCHNPEDPKLWVEKLYGWGWTLNMARLAAWVIRAAVADLAHGGAIDPYVCAGFPLERAVDAMRMLENRSVVGKCVVTMNGYEFEGA